MDTVDSAITKPVHRLEVFTGAGRRRTWSDEDKAGVVAETESSGDSVSSVARRHGLSPQQLFGCRHQLRQSEAIVSMSDEPRFVPAVVVAPSSDIARRKRRKSPRRHLAEHTAGTIEVEINGVTVRIGPGAPADTIAAVMRALKAGVIGPTGAVRVMVATKSVDFRKRSDGLAALVRESMAADPFSGAVYVFRAKRADRIKLVFWDGTGLCLFGKRLEDGIFRWPKIEDGVMHLSAAQLSALLEGLDWRCVHAVRETVTPVRPG